MLNTSSVCKKLVTACAKSFGEKSADDAPITVNGTKPLTVVHLSKLEWDTSMVEIGNGGI